MTERTAGQSSIFHPSEHYFTWTVDALTAPSSTSFRTARDGR
ncbi:hypothetical protein SLEP1_g17724 [Rubroshorea leprosula]|uniref:Uncharacterized protein n=1 Tax=Rubroshorea leprosula TaxID=152421 RepID=A0AAV5J5Q7_9ROSI|nr:hypothetical protein SLEP1_g17724 [Rubroshorea leprosula]